jgi:competence protein ComGC
MKIVTLILNSTQNAVQFIVEAVAEVFSLDHDDYPATGVMPYSGTIHRRH